MKSLIVVSMVAFVSGRIPFHPVAGDTLAPYAPYGGALFPNNDLQDRDNIYSEPVSPCPVSTSLPVIVIKSSKSSIESTTKPSVTSLAAGGVATMPLATSSTYHITFTSTHTGTAATVDSRSLATPTLSLFVPLTLPRTTTTTTLGVKVSPKVLVLSTFTMDGIAITVKSSPSIVFETTIIVTANPSDTSTSSGQITIPDAESQVAGSISRSFSTSFDLVTVISTLSGPVSTLAPSSTASIGSLTSTSIGSVLTSIIDSTKVPVSSSDTFIAPHLSTTSSILFSIAPTSSSIVIVAPTSSSVLLEVPTSSSSIPLEPQSSSGSRVVATSSSTLISTVAPPSSKDVIAVSSSSIVSISSTIAAPSIVTSGLESLSVDSSPQISSTKITVVDSSTTVIHQSSTTTLFTTIKPAPLASTLPYSDVSSATSVSSPALSAVVTGPGSFQTLSSPYATNAQSQIISSTTAVTSPNTTSPQELSTQTTSAVSSDVSSEATEVPSSSNLENKTTSGVSQVTPISQPTSVVVSISPSLAAPTNNFTTSTTYEPSSSTCTYLTVTHTTQSTHPAQTSTLSIPGMVGLPHASQIYTIPASTEIVHIATTIDICPTSTAILNVPTPLAQSTGLPSTSTTLPPSKTDSLSNNIYLSVPETFTAPAIAPSLTHSSTTPPTSPTLEQSTITSTIITETTRSPSSVPTPPKPSVSIIFTGGAPSELQCSSRLAFLVGFAAFSFWV